ncbi:MAG: HAD-IIB family hydrolase [Deltaproteobacteria bacterium]|nr:HAD-IIB family hydrolase [Deltaproteobacteria bacterium]
MNSLRAFVFDVDNTLTPPRRRLEPEMAEVLKNLPVTFHVAAGSDLALVQEQLVEPLQAAGYRGSFDAFVCNGSDRYRFELDGQTRLTSLRSFNLRNHLGASAFQTLMNTLENILNDPTFAIDAPGVRVFGEQIIDRGSMVNFAPIGRPKQMNPEAFANRDAFVVFDERTGYRHRILEHLRTALHGVIRDGGLRITFGGQTSFDIVIEGNDKTFPLRTLTEEGFTDLTYFGDALFEGGNDAAVLQFIAEHQEDQRLRVRAIQVAGWRDTLDQLLDLVQ